VISLFSGAGGLDLGLEMAGFRTAACVENDTDCRATLSSNRPEWRLIGEGSDGHGDIRRLSGSEILESAGLVRGEAALVAGGPPCQPFSSMGKGLGAADPRNGDLCLEFSRAVRECLPRTFIMENVPGLLHRKHRPLLERLLDEFKRAGYSVDHAVLNAADYGVPQLRKRLFLVGTRTGKRVSFPFPTHFESLDAWKQAAAQPQGTELGPFRPWATAGEALDRAAKLPEDRGDYALAKVSPEQKERMAFVKPGEDLRVLPMVMRPKRWRKEDYAGPYVFGRMRADRPSFTIRTEAYHPDQGHYIHPSEDRGLSTHEMAALQSFPPEWVFQSAKGGRIPLASAGRQIGNAVPPFLAQAVGLALWTALEERSSGPHQNARPLHASPSSFGHPLKG
jgi:DNA (cytosine-5)-methyltransferase 1